MRWLLTVGAVAGCYAPHLSPGSPCPDGVCPVGLVCSPATVTCEVRAIDAAVGSMTDAPAGNPDAPADASGPADAMTSGPMLIQQATAAVTGKDTLKITMMAPPQTGHLMVLIGAGTHTPIASITGGSQFWLPATQSGLNSNEEIWYGTADGTTLISITVPGSSIGEPIFGLVTEWSGLSSLAPMETARSGAGTTSPVSTGSIITASRDLIVFGASIFTPNTFGTPSPGTWTALTPVDSQATSQHAWYQVAPSGTYDPHVSVTSTGGWDAAQAAFRIAP